MNLDTLTASIKLEEGFRSLVYDDATGRPITSGTLVRGNPTIGYGWNVAASPISEAEASLILAHRLALAEAQTAILVPNWATLDDVRQNVLVDMCFNLGPVGLSRFKRLLLAVGEQRFEDAAMEMQTSAWYGQVGRRAVKLVAMMRTGVS